MRLCLARSLLSLAVLDLVPLLKQHPRFYSRAENAARTIRFPSTESHNRLLLGIWLRVRNEF